MNTLTRSVLNSSTSSARLAPVLGVATLVLLAVALAFSTANAQGAVPLPLASISEGARIRVMPVQGTAGLKSDAFVTGTVRRVTADSITFVTQASAPTTLAIAQLAALEASQGTRRRGKLGMGIGLAAGALGGGLLGLSTEDDFIFTNEEFALIGAVLFGAMGTVAGGLIGLAITSDVWRPVAIGASASRVSLRPMLGAKTGLSMRLSW